MQNDLCQQDKQKKQAQIECLFAVKTYENTARRSGVRAGEENCLSRAKNKGKACGA